jgi:hypothetical protein
MSIGLHYTRKAQVLGIMRSRECTFSTFDTDFRILILIKW